MNAVAAPTIEMPLSPRSLAVATTPAHISPHDRLLDDVTNVWDEIEKEKNLYLRTPSAESLSADSESPYNVRLATLNQLVALLTDGTPKTRGPLKVQAEEFAAIFFGTYLSFTTPSQVLQKLIERFAIPAEVQESSTPEFCVAIKKAVLGTLRYWIANHLSDFNEQLRNDILAFSRKALSQSVESEVRIAARFLEKSILKMFSSGCLTSARPEPLSPPPDSILPPHQWEPLERYTILDVDPLEVARQICLMDFKLYSQIQATDLLKCAWRDASRLRQEGNKLIGLISLFNTTASRFGHLVLSQSTLAARVQVIGFILRIMEYLDELNNFSSLMALLSALDWSPVHRLQHTFDALSSKQTTQLRNYHSLFVNSASYRNYRQRYSSVKPPSIPFAGIHLSDLTYVQDGNPDDINGLINFSKFTLIHGIVTQLTKHQSVPYHYRPLPQVLRLMEMIPIRTEEESFQISDRKSVV